MNEIEPSEIRQYKNGGFRHIIKKKIKMHDAYSFPQLAGHRMDKAMEQIRTLLYRRLLLMGFLSHSSQDLEAGKG